MRTIEIIKVNPRRPYGKVAFCGRNLSGYRESDNDYIANNVETVIQLLDREVKRARNLKRKARRAVVKP